VAAVILANIASNGNRNKFHASSSLVVKQHMTGAGQTLRQLQGSFRGYLADHFTGVGGNDLDHNPMGGIINGKVQITLGRLYEFFNIGDRFFQIVLLGRPCGWRGRFNLRLVLSATTGATEAWGACGG